MKSDYFSQVQHRKHRQLQKHYQEVGKRNHWFDQKKKTFRLYYFQLWWYYFTPALLKPYSQQSPTTTRLKMSILLRLKVYVSKTCRIKGHLWHNWSASISIHILLNWYNKNSNIDSSNIKYWLIKFFSSFRSSVIFHIFRFPEN